MKNKIIIFLNKLVYVLKNRTFKFPKVDFSVSQKIVLKSYDLKESDYLFLSEKQKSFIDSIVQCMDGRS